MTTAVQTLVPEKQLRTRVTWGAVLILTGLLVLFLFGFNAESGQIAKFGLNLAQKQAITIPDLVLPVQPSIYILTLVLVFFGSLQIARGVKSTGLLVGVLAFCFVAAFLIWAARGTSFSLVGMLSSSLVRATPIALAALCGVISERAGVTNIAIEGIMLIAAQAAVIAATVTHNLWFGLLCGILQPAGWSVPSMPSWSSASRWTRSSAA